MTIPRLTRLADLAPTPWANGRGQTIELARRPSTGPFAWRLSLATITEASPFSPLPGVSRALLTVDGSLSLVVDGRPCELGRHESVVFPGDAAVSVAAPAAAQRDLNLMVRGAATPALDTLAIDGRVTTTADVIAVVALDGEVTALGARLLPGDTVLTEGTETALRGRGTVAVATIH